MAPSGAAAAWIDAHRDKLAELAVDLIRFDTTCIEPSMKDGRTNDEEDCQGYIREVLGSLGAEVTAVKPNPGDFSTHPMMPSGHHWDGRSMTLARLPGSSGEGRSLILNGHIDVVDSGPVSRWSAPPFAGEIQKGQIIGRGASDMKGGIAAMLFALVALKNVGIALRGNVWVQTVTDEETNGMGTIALLPLQPAADAAIVSEPSHFDVWTACRGVLYGSATVTGRAGHAEMVHPDWHHGGVVNAISKLKAVLAAVEELEGRWKHKTHDLLASPSLVPTLVRGGEFIGSIPQACELTFDATYLPSDRDEFGFGSSVRAEVEREIAKGLSGDPWLAKHPLSWRWTSDYPPYELSGGDDLLASIEQCLAHTHRNFRCIGLNAWHDAAALGLFAGIPAVSCGPGRPESAHTVDESISIDDLVAGSQFFALLLCDYCGIASSPINP